MRRSSVLAGILSLPTVALALALLSASTWEGSAVVGAGGEFPGDGLYAACNSFPRNTSVVVTNLETGSSVTVVVTANFDNPGVFIALSPKAASSIGMQSGQVSRVRAVASIGGPEANAPIVRAGETTDPDYNPGLFMERDSKAQAAAEGKTAPASGQSPNAGAAQFIENAAATTAPAPAGAAAPAAAGAASSGAAAPAPAAPAPASSGAAASGAVASGVPAAAGTSAAALAEGAPEVSSERVASGSTQAGQADSGAIALAEPGAPGSESMVSGPKILPDEDLPRVAPPAATQATHPIAHPSEIEVAPAVASVPQTPSTTASSASAEPATTTTVALEPTAARPPASSSNGASSAALTETQSGPSAALAATAAATPAAGVTAATAAATPAATEAPVVAAIPTPARPPAGAAVLQGLKKGSYYVQVGVYRTNEAIQTAARTFAAYPLAVEKLESGSGITEYRLFVGPLTRDESGAALMHVRSHGYKDAFLKEGEPDRPAASAAS